LAEKTHITETPDTSHIKNIDVTHEVSDVYIGGIAKFTVGLVVLMIAAFLIVWGMFRALNSRIIEPPRSPMALSEKDRLPPEPRLQGAPGFAEELEKAAQAKSENKAEAGNEIKNTPPAPKDPMWEIRVVHDQWNDVLQNGPVDENGQRYGMPIEKAKEEVLKQLAEPQKAGAVSSRQ
jgi:hypothetical protein